MSPVPSCRLPAPCRPCSDSASAGVSALHPASSTRAEISGSGKSVSEAPPPIVTVCSAPPAPPTTAASGAVKWPTYVDGVWPVMSEWLDDARTMLSFITAAIITCCCDQSCQRLHHSNEGEHRACMKACVPTSNVHMYIQVIQFGKMSRCTKNACK